MSILRCRLLSRLLVVVVLLFCSMAAQAVENASDSKDTSPKKKSLEKIQPAFGCGYFIVKGYKTFLEPRVSFVKKKNDFSEVIEYSWRPMVLKGTPRSERIDRVRLGFNRYYFTGKDKRIFFGGGIGANVILFNDDLKKYGDANKLNLKDTVRGLGRVFVGYKISKVKVFNTEYPIVFRVDAFGSPDYKFGGELARAGDRLKLTEVTAGLGFSIE